MVELMGFTGHSAAYNIQTYTLNHTSIGISLNSTSPQTEIYSWPLTFTGQNIASHITYKRRQLKLSKLHSGVELASAATLTGEAEGHESDRADQQNNQFVHNIHSTNLLINTCPSIEISNNQIHTNA